jgi:hypothetical protein
MKMYFCYFKSLGAWCFAAAALEPNGTNMVIPGPWLSLGQGAIRDLQGWIGKRLPLFPLFVPGWDCQLLQSS